MAVERKKGLEYFINNISAKVAWTCQAVKKLLSHQHESLMPTPFPRIHHSSITWFITTTGTSDQPVLPLWLKHPSSYRSAEVDWALQSGRWEDENGCVFTAKSPATPLPCPNWLRSFSTMTAAERNPAPTQTTTVSPSHFLSLQSLILHAQFKHPEDFSVLPALIDLLQKTS